jgi:predicted transcriptional regulator
MPKLTLEFNDRLSQVLEQLAAKEDTSKVDIIRRALALYKYVDEQVGDNDNRHLAIAEDDKIVKEIVLR